MLTVRQAAERAGVCESLIYGWCADGTLPHYRLGRTGSRGKITISETDLDAFLLQFKRTEHEPALRTAPAHRTYFKHLKLN